MATQDNENDIDVVEKKLSPRFNFKDTLESVKQIMNDKNLEFEELMTLDRKRKEVIAQNKNFFMFYFSFQGKSVFLSILHPYFFFTFLIYGIFRYWKHASPNIYNQSNLGTLSITTSLMSFLLVFYLQQSYSRYIEQYKAIVAAQDRIHEIFSFGSIHLSNDIIITLWRYVNATHLLAYTSLSSHYNRDNFFTPINKKFLLLTKDEEAAIFEKRNDDSFHDALITYSWCIRLIANQMKQGKIVLPEETTMLTMLNQFKSALFVLFNFRDNPIPISYVHFVKVMEYIYLPTLSFTFATFKDLYQISGDHEGVLLVTLFMTTLFFIGLIELTNKFQDPFGQDLEDFRVLHYFEQSAITSAKIITFPVFNIDLDQEHIMWTNRLEVLKDLESDEKPMNQTSFNGLKRSSIIIPVTTKVDLNDKNRIPEV